MTTEPRGTWIEFYSEFATKLLVYKDRQDELIAIIKHVFDAKQVHLAKLDSVELFEIDPFTVYGLFNKGLSWDNRKKLTEGFKEEFGIAAPAPEDFYGLPVVNNLSATFYLFKPERGEDVIPTLWETFAAALAYADNSNDATRAALVEAFNKARKINRVKWNLTMALFWARPYFYLSLDSRNRWFGKDKAGLGKDFEAAITGLKDRMPDGETYLHINDLAKAQLATGEYSYKNIFDFTAEAWEVSERVNKEKAEAEKAAVVAMGDAGVEQVRYWIVSPGAESSRWEEFYADGVIGIGWSDIGDLNQYESRDEIKEVLSNTYGSETNYKNDSLALWQFCHDMKPGDIVYAKKGVKTLLGRGVVRGDYVFDEKRANKYKNVRAVDWQYKGEWEHPGKAASKTLTDITQYTDYVAKLEAIFADAEGAAPEVAEETYPAYTKEEFLNEVYISEPEYERLASLLRNKKNIILQGAPGVGKTFMAKRLAYSMMGVKDASRVKLVQFHQSYSYEDFIMGYRPTENGFELRTGAFYDFCKKAADDADNDYFFIIDEINRGNLSKIFGELFMLIEPDKRGASLQLLYANEQFSVPSNLYLIGMMNTADRSLAILDYALRRRFAFYEVGPAFQADGFRTYREGLASEKLDRLVAAVEQLNNAIVSDDTLGRGFRIGHSYFCGLEEASDERLSQIIDFELVPMLEEYWFDEPSKVSQWTNNLKSALR